jgi:hypothetical protein
LAVVIKAIGFVDASFFTAMFITKYKTQLVGEGPLRTLPLMKDGSPLPVLKEWKSGRSLLGRIKSVLNTGEPVEFGDVAIMQLDPGGYVPWAADAGATTDRYHLCLIPSPACWTYSGGSGAVLPVGQLTQVDHRALYSIVNFSEHACTHIVLDVK